MPSGCQARRYAGKGRNGHVPAAGNLDVSGTTRRQEKRRAGQLIGELQSFTRLTSWKHAGRRGSLKAVPYHIGKLADTREKDDIEVCEWRWMQRQESQGARNEVVNNECTLK